MRFWILIVAVVIAGLLWKVLVEGARYHKDEISIEAMTEQREALLVFERQIECEAHTLCSDATLDGQGKRDPLNAVRQCTIALERIDRVMIPDIFPEKIKRQLKKFKELLRVNVQSSLEQAKEDVAAQQRPTKYGLSVSFKGHSTCTAYSYIDKINRMYDVQKLMKGHYINCGVLQGI